MTVREQLEALLLGAVRDTPLIDSLVELINDEKAKSYGIGYRDAELRYRQRSCNC